MDTLPSDKTRWLQRLGAEAHVWLTRPDDVTAPDILQAYLALLSSQECERYRRFRFDDDRHHYLIAHALVRRALSVYVDVDSSSWQFSGNRYGRPEISAPENIPLLRFNLTHTRGLVACVVTLDHDCGIDIERLSARRNLMRVAEKMFAAGELQALQLLDGQAKLERFYSYWTLRESYCKALGVGIAHSKRDHCFTGQGSGQWTIGFDPCSREVSRHWQFELTKPTAEHVAAVAIRTAGAPEKSIIHNFVIP